MGSRGPLRPRTPYRCVVEEVAFLLSSCRPSPNVLLARSYSSRDELDGRFAQDTPLIRPHRYERRADLPHDLWASGLDYRLGQDEVDSRHSFAVPSPQNVLHLRGDLRVTISRTHVQELAEEALAGPEPLHPHSLHDLCEHLLPGRPGPVPLRSVRHGAVLVQVGRVALRAGEDQVELVRGLGGRGGGSAALGDQRLDAGRHCLDEGEAMVADVLVGQSQNDGRHGSSSAYERGGWVGGCRLLGATGCVAMEAPGGRTIEDEMLASRLPLIIKK